MTLCSFSKTIWMQKTWMKFNQVYDNWNTFFFENVLSPAEFEKKTVIQRKHLYKLSKLGNKTTSYCILYSLFWFVQDTGNFLVNNCVINPTTLWCGNKQLPTILSKYSFLLNQYWTLLPPANEVRGKVIFVQVSVCSQGVFVWYHFLSGCLIQCSF